MLVKFIFEVIYIICIHYIIWQIVPGVIYSVSEEHFIFISVSSIFLEVKIVTFSSTFNIWIDC